MSGEVFCICIFAGNQSIMKVFVTASLFVFAAFPAFAQLTTPADGTSVRARVSERVGLTDISIDYGRPAVKGRDGKIWGEVVYSGFKNQGFGNGKDSPWRAGANENTVIEFSTDVTIEGKTLKAGKYGFFVAYGADECTLIFSTATSSWGSYFYDPAEDVMRVKVKPVSIPYLKERLTYEFSDETDSTATVTLFWERKGIPFRVSTALHSLQMASFDRELRGERGFDPHALVQVASYLQEHNTRMDDALGYVTRASASMPTFGVLSLKADILRKMHKEQEADSTMKVALERASLRELHNYGRTLLREEKNAEALEIFRLNYDRHPHAYTACVGMMRGCAANGKSKDAIKYGKKALPVAPDDANRKYVEDAIASLKAGKGLGQ